MVQRRFLGFFQIIENGSGGANRLLVGFCFAKSISVEIFNAEMFSQDAKRVVQTKLPTHPARRHDRIQNIIRQQVRTFFDENFARMNAGDLVQQFVQRKTSRLKMAR